MVAGGADILVKNFFLAFYIISHRTVKISLTVVLKRVNEPVKFAKNMNSMWSKDVAVIDYNLYIDSIFQSYFLQFSLKDLISVESEGAALTPNFVSNIVSTGLFFLQKSLLLTNSQKTISSKMTWIKIRLAVKILDIC